MGATRRGLQNCHRGANAIKAGEYIALFWCHSFCDDQLERERRKTCIIDPSLILEYRGVATRRTGIQSLVCIFSRPRNFANRNPSVCEALPCVPGQSYEGWQSRSALPELFSQASLPE